MVIELFSLDTELANSPGAILANILILVVNLLLLELLVVNVMPTDNHVTKRGGVEFVSKNAVLIWIEGGDGGVSGDASRGSSRGSRLSAGSGGGFVDRHCSPARV